MGTKANPGQYDCYDKAEPDEPMFVLLARDKSAPALVMQWAAWAMGHGEKDKAIEAEDCAAAMRKWRAEHRPT